MRAEYILLLVMLVVASIIGFVLIAPPAHAARPSVAAVAAPDGGLYDSALHKKIPNAPKGGELDTKDDVVVPPLGDAPPKIAQGLAVAFEAGGKTDSRSARMLALYVPEGAPPTPFLPTGVFKATFEGDLTVSMKDDYIFTADGSGAVKLDVNGTVVLDATGDDLSKVTAKSITLRKGKNHIIARYDSPKKGDASLRVCWSSGDFAREVLPTIKLSHDAETKPLREARRVRDGRELFGALRCSRCHDAAPFVPANLEINDKFPGMPELGLDAPSFEGIGDRLNPAWIAQWVKDPRILRPDSSMPKVIHGASAEKDSEDIAGFLATCSEKKDAKAPEPPAAEIIAAGGQIFATLGCIGCHTRPDKEPVADRTPLKFVRTKWKAEALGAFLHQPDKHYAWIRMPNFRLSEEEAEKLAAFVMYQPIANDKSTIPPLKGAPDAEHGKKLVESIGCLNCHTLPNQKTSLHAAAVKDIPGAGWQRGCAADAPDKAPDFHLTADQRTALRAFAATDKKSLMTESPAEYAERRVKALRCAACHHRDDQDDHWSANTAELEGLVDNANAPRPEEAGAEVEQVRPVLTWTGEKLKPDWMTSFIKGEIAYKPRPWLHARMPGFKQHAAPLAKGLALEHGVSPTVPPETDSIKEQAELGRRLIGKREGLACTACHSVGKIEAVGVFEAPGINFMYVRERLRRNYFVRWLNNPGRVDPGTKMPNFLTDGKTLITEILGGDGPKQVESIWQFMLQGDKVTPPED